MAKPSGMPISEPKKKPRAMRCKLTLALSHSVPSWASSMNGVGKVFRSMQGSDYEAVRNFDLDIEAGEFFCLLGTSGCGKTTVLNMIAGFEPATSGSVEVAGQPSPAPARTVE